MMNSGDSRMIVMKIFPMFLPKYKISLRALFNIRLDSCCGLTMMQTRKCRHD